MKYRIFLFSVFALMGFLAYGQVAHAVVVPACPCDTLTIGDPGITGNEILEIVCPGGELVEGGSFVFDQDEVLVSTGDGEIGYSVFSGFESGACSIADGIARIFRLRPSEYELCRQSLINSCDLRLQRSIPTLSEWGLIATAGVLGLAGLYAVRRRRVCEDA